ncbi:MAG: DUF1761 domain-containing protein [Ignavibacteriae bacterium]|nr:DUF1761 domain-containing protein [Ignavibacteriota bacterium]
MKNISINHLAVFVCALLNLVVGAVWYSPVLFYRAWLQENNLREEDLKNANLAKLYGITFVLAWIISYNLAFFLGDDGTNWSWGLTAGFLAGFGWAATIFTIVAMFERRSWKYIFINGGYMVVYFSLIGLILGLWR